MLYINEGGTTLRRPFEDVVFILSEGGRMMLYMIGGSPCSGKSTIASLLARQYQLFHIKLDDLAGAILEAVIATPDMEEKQLADKLYDISAENFGRRVYEFYLDLGISKDFQKDLKPDESRTKRFAKSMMYLPSKIITLPVDGSTRIMRASRRQIQRIRKYLE